MKKIQLLFLLITCSFGYSKYAVADFIALNNGTDDDYHMYGCLLKTPS